MKRTIKGLEGKVEEISKKVKNSEMESRKEKLRKVEDEFRRSNIQIIRGPEKRDKRDK